MKKSRLSPGVVMRCFRDSHLVIGFELDLKISILGLITPGDRYLPGCQLQKRCRNCHSRTNIRVDGGKMCWFRDLTTPGYQCHGSCHGLLSSWFMLWFMSWFKPLKSTKQTWGVRTGVGQGPRDRHSPQSLSPMAPMLTYTHPLNPCTHGSKHSHTPILTPPSPMAQTQTPIPNPFHPWPPILTHTHPLNPFTHGPKHSHTPIPTPPSPMAQTQTPIPNPFHPWPPILTHTHPLNPFIHGPKHSNTPIPTPPSPMAKAQTPIPYPFHSWPPILTHTHPLNPFTHGPNTLIHPSPHPLHPWPRHRHPPLTHFTHGP